MPLTNYPNGVTSFGIPVVPLPLSAPPHGVVFWVNSATGTDGPSYGDAPNHAFATIKYALTRCSSGRGDVIIAANGHSETITAADHWPGIVASVTIVGQGVGLQRPTITWGTATTAQIVVDTYYNSFYNLIFNMNGIDAVAAGFSITGGSARFTNCKFLLGTAAAEAVLGVSIGTGGDDCRFVNCEFVGATTSGTTAAINTAVAIDGLVVDSCYFNANFGTAAINNATNAMTNARIVNNHAIILGAGKFLVAHASATGVVIGNHSLITANIAAGGSMTAAAMLKSQNYAQEAAGVASSTVVDPAAVAIT